MTSVSPTTTTTKAAEAGASQAQKDAASPEIEPPLQLPITSSPETPLTPVPKIMKGSEEQSRGVAQDNQEPTTDTVSQQFKIRRMLQEKLSPLFKERVNSDDMSLPKRIQSANYDQVPTQQQIIEDNHSELPEIRKKLSFTPMHQNATKNNHAMKSGQQQILDQAIPVRSSDPLEDTLTRLMDGLSEISHVGNDNIGARGEQDVGTPFLRSPTMSVDHQQPNAKDSCSMPFVQAHQPLPSNRQNVKIVGAAKLLPDRHQNQSHQVSSSSHHGQGLKLSIPKGILHNYRQAPTSTEVKASAAKKIQIQPLSPNESVMSMVSEKPLSTFLKNQGDRQESQLLGQAQTQLAATGGQHESQEQRQRMRIMSFSEASDTDSNMSHLSYQQKPNRNTTQSSFNQNLSLPQSSHSTNSGSDFDTGAKLIRRHRQGGAAEHQSQARRRRPTNQQQQMMSDQSYDSSDTRNKIRFSSKHAAPHSNNGSIDARRRDFVHPYAHQPTPAEKLHEICTNFGETSMFISYEVVVWILDKLWGLLINVLLLPIAILGLTLDYLRHQARRCPRRQNRQHLIRNQLIRAPNKKKNLQIVLDLDLTLVFCTNKKPEQMFAGTPVDQIPDYITVHNKEFGGEIFVYKRPHLREFLIKVSQLGTISVFTHHQRTYADPILDKLDPERRLIKHRFYSEHCSSNGDGEILKDMRYLEPMVENSQHVQAPNGQVRYSFSQRLNQAIGVNVFGATAFAGTATAVRNQGDIQLSKTLLSRLVIVDDGILTFNAYKNNTIRILQWKATVKNDRALLDCLELIQQLGNHRDANVSKDLQYVIDTTSMYQASQQTTVLQQQQPLQQQAQ